MTDASRWRRHRAFLPSLAVIVSAKMAGVLSVVCRIGIYGILQCTDEEVAEGVSAAWGMALECLEYKKKTAISIGRCGLFIIYCLRLHAAAVSLRES